MFYLSRRSAAKTETTKNTKHTKSLPQKSAKGARKTCLTTDEHG